MTIINKGYCYFCGETAEDYDEIGPTRIYICNDHECHKALRDEQIKDEIQYGTRDEAMFDNYDRYHC